MKDDRYLHSELTEQAIGLSMKILNDLKPGLDEKIYERALVTEFEENKIPYSQPQRFPIICKTKLLGELIPDLIVDSKVIVDTKAVPSFNDSHHFTNDWLSGNHRDGSWVVNKFQIPETPRETYHT